MVEWGIDLYLDQDTVQFLIQLQTAYNKKHPKKDDTKLDTASDKRGTELDNFSYFSMKTYVVTPH